MPSAALLINIPQRVGHLGHSGVTAAHEECVVLSQYAEVWVWVQQSVTGPLGTQEAEQIEAFAEL